jgi:hypothetical protein
METFKNNLRHINPGHQTHGVGIVFLRQGGQFFKDILINGKPPAIGIEKALIGKIDPLGESGSDCIDQDGKHYPGNGEYSGENLRIGEIGHSTPPCGKDFCVATESYHREGVFITERAGNDD